LPLEVVEVQPTPNPNAKKFVLNGLITDQPMSFLEAKAAGGHPLAARLFAIQGVSAVLLLRDFVTIGKFPDANWTQVTTKVKKVLASNWSQPS
jgi:hypothetical protein